MKQRLMRKNTVELVWWVVAALCSSYSLMNAAWPDEWAWLLGSAFALVFSVWRVGDHWQQL